MLPFERENLVKMSPAASFIVVVGGGRKARFVGLEMLFSTQNVGKTNTCSHLELLLEI